MSSKPKSSSTFLKQPCLFNDSFLEEINFIKENIQERIDEKTVLELKNKSENLTFINKLMDIIDTDTEELSCNDDKKTTWLKTVNIFLIF